METTPKSLKERMVYRKFDAIAVEGPFTAKDGQEFYKILFEENASDNGGYRTCSKGYSKNVFERSHSVIFKDCEKHLATEGRQPVKVMLGCESFPCDPYYIFDADGKPLMNTDGKQRIGANITVRLFQDESPDSEYRRQLRRIAAEGRFVDKEEVDTAGEKEAEVVKTATAGPKPGKK